MEKLADPNFVKTGLVKSNNLKSSSRRLSFNSSFSACSIGEGLAVLYTSFLQENKNDDMLIKKMSCFMPVSFSDYKINIANERNELKYFKKLFSSFYYTQHHFGYT
ncbi:MAG: hypothetical protein JWP81_2460 [Ferruginibacter sp.]|nr:hypothetical protein [Ferruginibacter sp.]